MRCFEEIVYSMFLDNELEPGQQQKVAAHLDQCNNCREQVRQMKEENLLITKAFEAGEESPDLVPAVMDRLIAPGARKNTRWVLAAAAVLVVAVFLSYFLWVDKTPVTPVETQVLICYARVEGQEIQKHIFNSEEPDTKYIWLEKQ